MHIKLQIARGLRRQAKSNWCTK